MKLSISLEDKLLAEMDAFAKEHYMTRSALIACSCTQYMAAVNATRAVKDIAKALRTAADKNELSPELRQQIDKYEQLSIALTGADSSLS